MLQLPNPESVIALGNGRYAARVAGNNCRMSWGKFKDIDQGSYDVVYAYLSPAAMGDLWTKARREMRAGTLLISNSFDIPGVPPSLSVTTGARGDSTLPLWQM